MTRAPGPWIAPETRWRDVAEVEGGTVVAQEPVSLVDMAPRDKLEARRGVAVVSAAFAKPVVCTVPSTLREERVSADKHYQEVEQTYLRALTKMAYGLTFGLLRSRLEGVKFLGVGDIGGDGVYNELRERYDEKGFPGSYVGITTKWDQHIGLPVRVDQYTEEKEGVRPRLYIAAEEQDMGRLLESLGVDLVIFLSLGIPEVTIDEGGNSFAIYSPTLTAYGYPIEERLTEGRTKPVKRATPLLMLKVKDSVGLASPCSTTCDMKAMALVEAEMGFNHLDPTASYLEDVRKAMPTPLKLFVEKAVEGVLKALGRE